MALHVRPAQPAFIAPMAQITYHARLDLLPMAVLQPVPPAKLGPPPWERRHNSLAYRV